MRSIGRVWRTLWFGGLLLVVACGTEGTSGTSAQKAEPAAQYQSRDGHFRGLLEAGLLGDYTAFATHLHSDRPEEIIALLNQNFKGEGFDVYTWKAAEGPNSHRRIVELRSTDARLYLFLKLNKVTGGWHVASYDLGRDRSAIAAKMG